ncbi:MAG: DUF1801 domain-containing protein [Gemmataceae bacterium]
MAASRKVPKGTDSTSRRSDHDDTAAVTAYLTSLNHPLKPVLEAIRRTILKADRAITEGIKWNSPSFYCHGWFATINLRAKSGAMIVLHHGAKARADNTLSRTIDDSTQLLTWLAPDRAVVSFVDGEDFRRKRGAFQKIVEQWAAYQTLNAASAD